MWRQLRNLHPRDADGKERFLRNVHHLHSQHLFSDVKFCVAAFNDFDTPFGPSTLLADLLQLVNQNLLRFELLFVLPPDAVFGQLQAQLICAVEAGEADLAPLLHRTLALAALDAPPSPALPALASPPAAPPGPSAPSTRRLAARLQAFVGSVRGWLEPANHDRDPRLAAACFRAHLRLVQTAANAAVPSAHQSFVVDSLHHLLVAEPAPARGDPAGLRQAVLRLQALALEALSAEEQGTVKATSPYPVPLEAMWAAVLAALPLPAALGAVAAAGRAPAARWPCVLHLLGWLLREGSAYSPVDVLATVTRILEVSVRREDEAGVGVAVLLARYCCAASTALDYVDWVHLHLLRPPPAGDDASAAALQLAVRALQLLLPADPPHLVSIQLQALQFLPRPCRAVAADYIAAAQPLTAKPEQPTGTAPILEPSTEERVEQLLQEFRQLDAIPPPLFNFKLFRKAWLLSDLLPALFSWKPPDQGPAADVLAQARRDLVARLHATEFLPRPLLAQYEAAVTPPAAGHEEDLMGRLTQSTPAAKQDTGSASPARSPLLSPGRSWAAALHGLTATLEDCALGRADVGACPPAICRAGSALRHVLDACPTAEHRPALAARALLDDVWAALAAGLHRQVAANVPDWNPLRGWPGPLVRPLALVPFLRDHRPVLLAKLAAECRAAILPAALAAPSLPHAAWLVVAATLGRDDWATDEWLGPPCPHPASLVEDALQAALLPAGPDAVLAACRALLLPLCGCGLAWADRVAIAPASGLAPRAPGGGPPSLAPGPPGEVVVRLPAVALQLVHWAVLRGHALYAADCPAEGRPAPTQSTTRQRWQECLALFQSIQCPELLRLLRATPPLPLRGFVQLEWAAEAGDAPADADRTISQGAWLSYYHNALSELSNTSLSTGLEGTGGPHRLLCMATATLWAVLDAAVAGGNTAPRRPAAGHTGGRRALIAVIAELLQTAEGDSYYCHGTTTTPVLCCLQRLCSERGAPVELREAGDLLHSMPAAAFLQPVPARAIEACVTGLGAEPGAEPPAAEIAMSGPSGPAAYFGSPLPLPSGPASPAALAAAWVGVLDSLLAAGAEGDALVPALWRVMCQRPTHPTAASLLAALPHAPLLCTAIARRWEALRWYEELYGPCLGDGGPAADWGWSPDAATPPLPSLGLGDWQAVFQVMHDALRETLDTGASDRAITAIADFARRFPLCAATVLADLATVAITTTTCADRGSSPRAAGPWTAVVPQPAPLAAVRLYRLVAAVLDTMKCPAEPPGRAVPGPPDFAMALFRLCAAALLDYARWGRCLLGRPTDDDDQRAHTGVVDWLLTVSQLVMSLFPEVTETWQNLEGCGSGDPDLSEAVVLLQLWAGLPATGGPEVAGGLLPVLRRVLQAYQRVFAAITARRGMDDSGDVHRTTEICLLLSSEQLCKGEPLGWALGPLGVLQLPQLVSDCSTRIKPGSSIPAPHRLADLPPGTPQPNNAGGQCYTILPCPKDQTVCLADLSKRGCICWRKVKLIGTKRVKSERVQQGRRQGHV